MPIQGYVDQITHTHVVGWVIDWDQPTTPVDVLIVVDGVEIARCQASHMRERLRTVLGGDATGAHEFQHRFDPPLDNRYDHTVEIWSAEPQTQLTNGRRIFFGERSGKGGFVPIVITSSGRSGTTALMQDFAGHPEIVVADTYPFEIKLTSYYAATLNVLSAPTFVPSRVEREFAAFATRDLIAGRNPWNRPQLLNMVGKNHAARLIGRTFPDRLRDLFRSTIEEYYSIIADESDRSQTAHLFAEKGVLETPVRKAARSMFPAMKEVVMVRDPRDFLCSANQFWKHDLDAVISTMRSEFPLIQAIFKEAHPNTMFVRYEDLVLEPERTKNKLYEFLGCKDSVSDMKRASVPESHRTSRSAQSSIGRFREELDDQTLRLCKDHFQGFMEIFGYTD